LEEKEALVKNLLLLSIVGLLIVFIYFFEELGSIKSAKENELKDTLFDSSKVGKLLGFSTGKVSFISDKTLFRDKSTLQLVDQAKMNKVFSILSQLKMSTIVPADKINGQEILFIPNSSRYFTFHFQNKEVKAILGKQLDFSQSFYLKIISNGNEKIVVANDSSPLEGSYMQKDFHRNNQKYRRLHNLLGLGNSFYLDKHIFPRFFYSKGRLKWKKIIIDNFRNRKFSVDLEKGLLEPKPIVGVSVNKLALEKLANRLANMEGESSILEYKESKLKQLVSTITMIDDSDKLYWIKLYKKLGEIDGYFLLTSRNRLLSLSKLSASPLFSNMQNLWNKKIGIEKRAFDFKLSLNSNKTVLVKVNNFQSFETSSENYITRHSEFKKLISFFEGEASLITKLDKSDKVLFEKPLMSISFMGLDFDIIFKDSEVLALNKSVGVVYHYLVGENLPFSTEHNSYFKSR
jgi:hypothetical protein